MQGGACTAVACLERSVPIVWHRLALVGWEEHQMREALDVCQVCMLIGRPVQLGNAQRGHLLQLPSQLLPGRRQRLAVPCNVVGMSCLFALAAAERMMQGSACNSIEDWTAGPPVCWTLVGRVARVACICLACSAAV